MDDALTAWSAAIAGHSRVALDTNAVIYFLDRTEPYFELVRSVFMRAEEGALEIVICALVETELLVGPLRKGDDGAVEAVRLLLDHFPNLHVEPIGRAAAQRAAALRAAQALPTPDALIVGTAWAAECDALIGNDRLCAARVTSPEYLALYRFVEGDGAARP